jgi:hypothetical protein
MTKYEKKQAKYEMRHTNDMMQVAEHSGVVLPAPPVKKPRWDGTEKVPLTFSDRVALGQMKKAGELAADVADRLRAGTATPPELLDFAVKIATRCHEQDANAERRKLRRANPSISLDISAGEEVAATT